MIKVSQLAHYLDRKKPEFFTWLKRKGLITKEPQKYQDLSDKQKVAY